MFCLQQNLEMLRLIEPFWYMGARKPGKKLSHAGLQYQKGNRWKMACSCSWHI